jgi:hypothetical protein
MLVVLVVWSERHDRAIGAKSCISALCNIIWIFKIACDLKSKKMNIKSVHNTKATPLRLGPPTYDDGYLCVMLELANPVGIQELCGQWQCPNTLA